MSKSDHGFTMIELMIVVAIMGTLASIAIPNYSKYKDKVIESEVTALLAMGLRGSQSYWHTEHAAEGTSAEMVTHCIVYCSMAPWTTEGKVALKRPAAGHENRCAAIGMNIDAPTTLNVASGRGIGAGVSVKCYRPNELSYNQSPAWVGVSRKADGTVTGWTRRFHVRDGELIQGRYNRYYTQY